MGSVIEHKRAPVHVYVSIQIIFILFELNGMVNDNIEFANCLIVFKFSQIQLINWATYQISVKIQ